jgi:hypothetical protein
MIAIANGYTTVSYALFPFGNTPPYTVSNSRMLVDQDNNMGNNQLRGIYI